ncbi:MAG: efflux RND transporter periplasmic adaptor subunit [Pseudomonadaceae bacterium]|nr:efflux RND transporter periplasmic adaptor subunit [Pseudomonadaceae bacterium]
MIGKILGIVLVTNLLLSCSDNDTKVEEPIKGLRVFEVSNTAQFVERRYPGVVQPHDETRLAFEVGGQLESVDLDEGQFVESDTTLLQLNTTTFDLRVQEAKAGLDQAQAQRRNAQVEFERQAELWQKKVIPRAAYDNAEALLDTTTAQLEQATRRLEIARDNLAKTKLIAPFDGYIASVEADSFATVAAGRSVLTLYADDAFETEISVPSEVINRVAVGQPALIVVPELTNARFQGTIAEVGLRAPNVAAFPAVVVFNDPGELIKAGMAAEVTIQIPLSDSNEGFLVPLTCFAFDDVDQLEPGQTEVKVYIYDPDTSTVGERSIVVTEFRDNQAVVHRGLNVGDLVASAGVSYLRDGQRVKLLSVD